MKKYSRRNFCSKEAIEMIIKKTNKNDKLDMYVFIRLSHAVKKQNTTTLMLSFHFSLA